jgi:hypothetical protein
LTRRRTGLNQLDRLPSSANFGATKGATDGLFIEPQPVGLAPSITPMSKFISQLFLRSYSAAEIAANGGDKQLYAVTRSFAYVSDKLGRTIAVPRGFVTDFASIPRPAWEILDPEDPIIAWPSVIHDYLYSCKGTLPDGFIYGREQADAVLREAMEVCGASSFIRNAVYQAVQKFGGSHWG